MIRIQPAPEPPTFDALIRVPGAAFLAKTPRPTSKQFRSHSYWTRSIPDLRSAYSSICAYCCHRIHADVGVDTVDHYWPKVPHPDRAYEWSNYRLVSSRLNNRKSTKDDVLDPFEIENGWFVIDFPSLLVKPGQGLQADVRDKVLRSINRVKLNDASTCLKERFTYVNDFCELGRPFFDLVIRRDAPFLAAEILRQGLIDTLPGMMRVAP